jgi:hypothetical protein
LPRRKPHRAVDVDVAVTPLLDAVVLEARVPEHCHCLPRAQKLRLSREKPSKIRSKTSLSQTSLHHPT